VIEKSDRKIWLHNGHGHIACSIWVSALTYARPKGLKLLVVRLLWGVVQMDKKKFLIWMTLGASVMALAIFRKMMRYPGDEYDRGKERPYRPAP
jgi:hypothetical protein